MCRDPGRECTVSLRWSCPTSVGRAFFTTTTTLAGSAQSRFPHLEPRQHRQVEAPPGLSGRPRTSTRVMPCRSQALARAARSYRPAVSTCRTRAPVQATGSKPVAGAVRNANCGSTNRAPTRSPKSVTSPDRTMAASGSSSRSPSLGVPQFATSGCPSPAVTESNTLPSSSRIVADRGGADVPHQADTSIRSPRDATASRGPRRDAA